MTVPCDYEELRPHPSDCSMFLQCSNGDEYDMPCPLGQNDVRLHFSYDSQTCDYPENVDCQVGKRS